MHHTYGLSYTAMRSILTPVTLVYLPQWDADAALNAIEKFVSHLILSYSFLSRLLIRYRVTTFNVVPSMIRTLLERQKVRKADLSSLLSIGAGAAYLPPELEAQLGSVKKQMKISQG
jgi:acyl-CoA synthetase (AMP-forming)/AMP-acid ligase II